MLALQVAHRVNQVDGSAREEAAREKAARD
jgi:hypothetical protein